MEYQKRYDEIVNHLNNGNRVMICTYARATIYEKKHVNYFMINPSGLYVKRGKQKDCLNFTAVKLI